MWCEWRKWILKGCKVGRYRNNSVPSPNLFSSPHACLRNGIPTTCTRTAGLVRNNLPRKDLPPPSRRHRSSYYCWPSWSPQTTLKSCASLLLAGVDARTAWHWSDYCSVSNTTTSSRDQSRRLVKESSACCCCCCCCFYVGMPSEASQA
jgi:streptolysin S family bacteriocin protoxin